VCQKHWAPMWFVRGAGEEAKDHQLMKCKLYVSSTKSVVCIAWTLTSMSSKFCLHDYTKVAFRLCHGLKCKKENWARSQPRTWRNKLFTSRTADNHDDEWNQVPAERELATTSSVVFLLTYLPTHNPSYVLTTHLDFW
jgi:hypothetical protein